LIVKRVTGILFHKYSVSRIFIMQYDLPETAAHSPQPTRPSPRPFQDGNQVRVFAFGEGGRGDNIAPVVGHVHAETLQAFVGEFRTNVFFVDFRPAASQYDEPGDAEQFALVVGRGKLVDG
jgi:hypothetical protein